MLIVMYSLEQVREALDTEELSDALSKLELYAEEQGIDDVARWARAELRGYDAAEELPEYRDLPATERNVAGRLIFKRRVKLGSSINEAEAHKSAGLELGEPDHLLVSPAGL